MSDKDDIVFVNHILDSINAIENFSNDISKGDLISNRLIRSAIVRELEVIGEATKNLSINFKKVNDQIPWKEIIGTRDKMIHHYFGINVDMVWDIIVKDLPELKKQLNKINHFKFHDK